MPAGSERELPPNLHMSGPSNGAHPLLERVEQKFFVAPARVTLAVAVLRLTCRWDGQYPDEQITSLYFDTPDLDQHERSLAGEYAKDKVRIRWYGTAGDPASEVSASEVIALGVPASEVPAVASPASSGADTVAIWLELKSRRGFASTKQRRRMQVPAEALVFGALRQGIVPATTLAETMAGFGFIARGRLLPVIVISYRRHRFVEPRTGFRVALDSHIRSSMVMPGIGRGERDLELPGAVVEVKGPSGELAHCLRTLADIGSSWTRYSKYSASLDAHAADPGSVSRLWPSGTMHAEACTEVPRPTGGAATCGNN